MDLESQSQPGSTLGSRVGKDYLALSTLLKKYLASG